MTSTTTTLINSSSVIAVLARVLAVVFLVLFAAGCFVLTAVASHFVPGMTYTMAPNYGLALASTIMCVLSASLALMIATR